MVVVGLLAVEECDLQTTTSHCSSGSTTSWGFKVEEFEISGGEGVIADANGEGIFDVVGIKDESFIKGEVDDRARGLNGG